MPQIEVIELLPELDPGGAERVVLWVVEHLARQQNIRFSVAAIDAGGALAERFRAAGCEVHDLGGGQLRAVSQLRQLLYQRQPALLNSHLFRAHILAAMAIKGITGTRWIATEHQADPRLWARLVFAWASRRAALVTAVSESVRQQLLDDRLLPDRVITIPNGIDLRPVDEARPLPRAQLGLREGNQVLLFAGRLVQQKGVDVLIQAAASLADLWPRLHLLIAGDGRDRQPLEAMARRKLISERVSFLGRRDDVPQLMKAADIIVMPSRWEGLPLALLEAMTAGRAIVATNVEGNRDVLVDGESALMVPSENPTALASAISRLLADPQLRAKLGKAAETRARRDYSAARMATQYGVLYEEMAQQ